MTKKISFDWYLAGNNYGPVVNAYVAKLNALGLIKPNKSVLVALRDFIASLDGYGLWSKCLTMNQMHSGSVGAVTVNLKNPDAYQWTTSGSIVFSEGNGCRSDLSSYFNQPFKSNEFSGIETNLTSIQYISESSTTTGSFSGQGFRATASIYFVTRPLSSASTGQIFSYSTTGSFSNTNKKGLYIHVSGAESTIYKDGVKTSIVRTATSPTLSQNRLILAFNNDTGNGITPSGQMNTYVAIDALFTVFNDTDAANFKTAFDNYKTAVGLP